MQPPPETFKIELDSDQVAGSYLNYQEDPSPKNLNATIRALEPSINYSLGSIDAAGDPMMTAKARTLTAKAVQSFDPSRGSKLSSYVVSQLQPLKRYKRMVRSPVSLPDRLQLDSFSLQRAEKEYLDEHGREPDTMELSDYSKIPVKRIEKIRMSSRSIPSEKELPDMMSGIDIDFSGEAVDYIYHDSDHVNRMILEHKMGYGGKEILTTTELANKLKISLPALSKRSAKLAWRIQDMLGSMEQNF